MTENYVTLTVAKLDAPDMPPSLTVFPTADGDTIELQVIVTSMDITVLRALAATLAEALNSEDRVEVDLSEHLS